MNGSSSNFRAEHGEIYLRDHYAGAVGAIELLEHLAGTAQDKALAKFFQQLLAEVKADLKTLDELMSALEFDQSKVRNAGAWMAEKIARLKLGGGGDQLELFQALETLYLGITGKYLLWRTLGRVRNPVLARTDFAALEKRAMQQLESVEAKRLELAESAFSEANKK